LKPWRKKIKFDMDIVMALGLMVVIKVIVIDWLGIV